MPNITLLVSPSCGACPSAKSLWKQLRVKYSFSYREVDITTKDGQELADRHSVRAVPATIIDGRLTFVGAPSRERGKSHSIEDQTTRRVGRPWTKTISSSRIFHFLTRVLHPIARSAEIPCP